MSFIPNRSFIIILSLAVGAGGFALGFKRHQPPAPSAQGAKLMVEPPPAPPKKERLSPRSTLAAALQVSRGAFNATRLDEVWRTVPHDEFYSADEIQQAVELHPAELHGWLEERKRWPLFHEDDEMLEHVIRKVFTAWVAKDPRAALNASLHCANFMRRGMALNTLSESRQSSIVPDALGAYLAEKRYRFLFGDAFDATGRSVEENIAFLQTLSSSPGRDARLASYLNEANETAPDQIASHWNTLSTEERAALVKGGFIARKAAGTKQFPDLLELAQQNLTTSLSSHERRAASSYFWNGIGGAWVREDFTAAWKWFRTNSGNIDQMLTEAQVLRQAFEHHPEQVIEIVRELPSLTREMKVLQEIHRHCPPDLRSQLNNIISELPVQAQRMLSQ
jgi:uncharacterized protein YdbL (DUF1318 family)